MNVQYLEDAFNSFMTASKSLETYYRLLQEKVRHLTVELNEKNRRLKDALSVAQESKDYLNAVLYNIEDAVIVVDQNDRVVMINKAAENLIGLNCRDVVGKMLADVDFSITSEGSDVFLSTRGRKYNIIFSRSQVVDSNGFLRGSVILIKDITRLREIEVHYERNKRLIAMGEMAAKIVHEIRNPLCSIELFASMLEKELNDPVHKKLAGGISTSIANLNNILTNMLLFARPHKLAFKTIELSNIVEDCIAVFKPLMDTRNVSLEKNTIVCEISGDEELLKQVIINIIINAIQAMPDGGNISIAMRLENSYVVIDIKDEGIGIKQQNIERIFDPFFTTKDSGTGLGLAIAFTIMQAHNGYIKVESIEGKGSTFSLYLPLKEGK